MVQACDDPDELITQVGTPGAVWNTQLFGEPGVYLGYTSSRPVPKVSTVGNTRAYAYPGY